MSLKVCNCFWPNQDNLKVERWNPKGICVLFINVLQVKEWSPFERAGSHYGFMSFLTLPPLSLSASFFEKERHSVSSLSALPNQQIVECALSILQAALLEQ